MRYLSVCSGIEAASVAWHPLGWEPWAFSEIEAFPSAVLKHHYPHVPNLGDMTHFEDWPDAAIDLLVGGTPCQSFSVAGLRAGLADPRGNLALTFLAIADKYRPEWVVWENVPGVFSATSHDAPDPRPPANDVDGDKGLEDGAEVVVEDEYDADEVHAFSCLLAGFSELGYLGTYRTLDAQYFGLAQRRQRVFAVFHLGDWRRPAAVLFERASLSGHPAPRRTTGEGIAPTVSSGAPFSRTGNERVELDAMVPEVAGTLGGASQSGGFRTTDLDNVGAYVPEIVAQAMSAKWSKGSSGPAGDEVANLIAFDTTQITHPENRSNPQPGDPCPSLAKGAHAPPIAFGITDDETVGDDLLGTMATPSQSGGGHPLAVAFAELADPVAANQTAMHVRRLTPRECERLQGFPDDYTLIPYRGKLAKDGPRYKALGNSMAVPVMRWIGRRISMVEALPK